MRFICEANLAASSRATLEARANAANDAHTTSIRRTLNLKLWDQNAVRVGARKDQCLKLLNVREAEENARMLRCDRAEDHYVDMGENEGHERRQGRDIVCTLPSLYNMSVYIHY